jgi:acyl-CoA reductase-like NAD-dependent aldehyde dehydrogenase
MVEAPLFVGGEQRTTGAWVERENPARPDELVGRAAMADPALATEAVDDAAGAAEGWRSTDVGERVAAVVAAVGEMPDVAPLLTAELGKTVAGSVGELGFARTYASMVADRAPEVCADADVETRFGRALVTKEPFGATVAIVPWNAPLILSMLKVAPALMAGNTLVLKPSPLAPLAVARAFSAMAAALPAGVLQVVQGGADVGEALVTAPAVAKVSFTGGERTAEHILRSLAPGLTPAVLELGGNDPAILLDDVELSDDLLHRLVMGSFLTAGQVCMATKRVLVPESRFDEVVDAYLAAADAALVVGDPADPATTLGPVVSADAKERVDALVDGARAGGADVREVGTVPDRSLIDAGWFVRPTVVLGADDADPIVSTEQFGPTVPIQSYRTVDEAVARANAGPYGLSSSVWSADEDRAVAVARRIRSGTTSVNAANRWGLNPLVPFGGMGRSGFGREYGDAGIEGWLQTHAITVPSSVGTY